MSHKKHMIVRSVFMIIGIILLLWFVLPAIHTRSVNFGSVTGTVISLLLMAYGFWFNGINSFLAAAFHTLSGKILEIIALVLAAVILVLAAVTGIAMIKGVSKTAEPGSTVIVLGARLYDNSPSRTMMIRCQAACEYLKNNPESKCIVSGGQGSNEKRSEASAMYDLLIEDGIEPERIYIEDRSTDTDENMRYSQQIIEENNLNPVTAIATNDYHEYRALSYAAAAGLEAGAVPAGTLWWLWPTSVIREMYGILEMWLLK